MACTSLIRSVARLAVALAAVLGANLQAAVIEAEGVASIDGGSVEHARSIAINDAVQRISLQLGAVIAGSEQMTSGGAIVQSGTVRPAARIDRYAVVREWNDGHNLHVLVSADERDAAPAAAPVRMYRKKILVTPFYISKPAHVTDLDDVTYGMPKDIARRLVETGQFQLRASSYALPEDRAGTSPAHLSSIVKQLAIENDSQFVLAGEVIDAGTIEEKGVFTSRTVRNFEVRAVLYDGITGTLLAEHRIHRSADENTVIGPGLPFGSTSFFSTKFGTAIDSALRALAIAVVADLEPIPFTARITRVANSQVFFDAGATSAVQPGDSLVAYRRKSEWNDGASMPAAIGSTESPVATVSVLQVHPAFSIGELLADPGSISLKPGDYVRLLSSK